MKKIILLLGVILLISGSLLAQKEVPETRVIRARRQANTLKIKEISERNEFSQKIRDISLDMLKDTAYHQGKISSKGFEGIVYWQTRETKYWTSSSEDMIIFKIIPQDGRPSLGVSLKRGEKLRVKLLPGNYICSASIGDRELGTHAFKVGPSIQYFLGEEVYWFVGYTGDARTR